MILTLSVHFLNPTENLSLLKKVRISVLIFLLHSKGVSYLHLQNNLLGILAGLHQSKVLHQLILAKTYIIS